MTTDYTSADTPALTDDEKNTLLIALHDDHCEPRCGADVSTYRPVTKNVAAAIERILTARLGPLQAERDALREQIEVSESVAEMVASDRDEALGNVDAMELRAEQAEAERDDYRNRLAATDASWATVAAARDRYRAAWQSARRSAAQARRAAEDAEDRERDTRELARECADELLTRRAQLRALRHAIYVLCNGEQLHDEHVRYCVPLREALGALPAPEPTVLTFADVSVTNRRRCERWHPGFPHDEKWVISDWSNAVGGEAGELQNVVKKLRRYETEQPSATDPPVEVLLAKAGEEAADVILYLDLLCTRLGIDLAAAIIAKFDAVSVREGFPDRMIPVAASLAALPVGDAR